MPGTISHTKLPKSHKMAVFMQSSELMVLFRYVAKKLTSLVEYRTRDNDPADLEMNYRLTTDPLQILRSSVSSLWTQRKWSYRS